MTFLRPQPSQGQQIVLGWDNENLLKDWVAYRGTDNEPFQPPSDRNGFSDGVERRLATGRVMMAGFPISRQTFPWITYAQIDYLMNTFNGQNVTVAVHTPYSINKTDTVIYNAVCNVDMLQTATLNKIRNGYENFVVELVLVEPL